MPALPGCVSLHRMSQRPRIVIAQQQRLALNTGLTAAIRLLRSDAAGLTRYLEEQAATNPHVRLVGPDAASLGDWLPRWSGVLTYGPRSRVAPPETASADPSLISHVTAAVRAMRLPPAGQRIALALVEALEPSGWLGRSVAAIADDLNLPEPEVLAILQRLQTIEPTGLFARNLGECLALQAAEMGQLDPEMAVLLQNLDLLAAGDIPRLTRLCRCDEAGIARRFRSIRTMNPKPGSSFAQTNPAITREPDLIARPLKNGRWQVALNRSALPTVEITPDPKGDPPALQAARALRHMVEARNATLLRVGREIVARQSAALLQGAAALAPMGMADLAEALGVHVSTISRVVAGATLDAPTGVLWLRRMFSGARRGKDNDAPPQAVAALRHRLSRIIATENRAKPLSDAALVVRLAEDSGVTLARRTIAQYREAEGIPPAYRRRLRVMTTRKRIAAPKANQD